MLLAGAVLAGQLFSAELPVSIKWTWISGIDPGWYIDPVSALLICLVYLISLLVQIFSIHYLKGDPGMSRYYFKLGFFTSSMLGLLAADHLILLFVFWELVGFSSYLLIGFWYSDPERARSARDAFMINRLADAGLLTGIILLITDFGQADLSALSPLPSSMAGILTGSALLVGVLGKSAQLPFSGWLTKAMAGPTPVSALIHAATMVAAGVYLLIRLAPVLPPEVLNAAALIGGATALIAALSALVQHDIKKVLAYSTISQLGYMIMGIGAGAYQASLFHLWTHAFFKAGLFLAAGSVISYFHRFQDHAFDAQDMRRMGGLRKALPITFATFIICGLALSGLPFFSGFLSKEGILSGAWIWADRLSSTGAGWAYLVPAMAFFAAFLTPVYTGRQFFLVFSGKPRSEHGPLKDNEPLLFVGVPLILLAAGSVWLFNALNPLNPGGWWFRSFLFAMEVADETTSVDSIRLYTLILSIGLSMAGLLVSFVYFGPQRTYVKAYRGMSAPAKGFGYLLFHGWFLNHLYAAGIIRYQQVTGSIASFDRRIIDWIFNAIGVGTVVFSKLLAIVDREFIDGLVHLIGWVARGIGTLFSKIQSARIQSQIAWMAIALALLLFWFQF